MDLDFNNIETGEDLSKDSHSAVRAADIAEYTKQGRILAKKHGMKVSTWCSREAKNPLTQEQYNARFYTLCNMVRNTELADRQHAFSKTWKEIYPHVPYPEKITDRELWSEHKVKLKKLMQDEGVWRHSAHQKVSDYIDTCTLSHRNKLLLAKDREISKLQEYVMVLDKDSKDIWYKGHKITRTTRELRCTVHGVKMAVPLKAIDKLFEIFDKIELTKST